MTTEIDLSHNQSKLLNLPPEIRTLIFRYIFYDVGVNLGLRYKIFLQQKEQKSSNQQGILFPHPVCFVSRLMYQESINVFYEEATIHYSSTFHFKLSPSLMSKLCHLDLEATHLRSDLGGHTVEFPQLLGHTKSGTWERTTLPDFPNLKSLRAVVSVPLEPDFENRRRSSIILLTGLVHFRKHFKLVLDIRFHSFFRTEVQVVSKQTESGGNFTFHKGDSSHPVWRRYGYRIFGIGTDACPLSTLACLNNLEKDKYVVPWENLTELRYEEVDRIQNLIAKEMQPSFVEGWTKNWEWRNNRLWRPV